MSAAPVSGHVADDVALAFALDALDDGTRLQVAAHVAQCPACAATIAAARRERTRLFDLMSAAADARPPSRRTEWSAVRDVILDRPRGYAAAWRWVAGAVGGVSAPFLFAVGVASAAGIGYAALPPIRYAVDRALLRLIAPAIDAPPPIASVTPAAAAPSPTTPPSATVTAPASGAGAADPSARRTDVRVGAGTAAPATPTPAGPMTATPTATALSSAAATAAFGGPSGAADTAATAPPSTPMPTVAASQSEPPTAVPPLQVVDQTPVPGVVDPGPLEPRPGRPGAPRPPGPGPGPRPTEGAHPTPDPSRPPPRRPHRPGRGRDGRPDEPPGHPTAAPPQP